MAWVTPVTNRSSGASRMTYLDMNRITGNINFVYDLITERGFVITGGKVSKDSWTRNDIIEKTFWESMLTVLSNICSAVSYVPGTSPTNVMGYANINNIEAITLALYNYANDDWLLSESGVILATEDGVFIQVS